jgi:hypothetical protein
MATAETTGGLVTPITMWLEQTIYPSKFIYVEDIKLWTNYVKCKKNTLEQHYKIFQNDDILSLVSKC